MTTIQNLNNSNGIEKQADKDMAKLKKCSTVLVVDNPTFQIANNDENKNSETLNLEDMQLAVQTLQQKNDDFAAKDPLVGILDKIVEGILSILGTKQSENTTEETVDENEPKQESPQEKSDEKTQEDDGLFSFLGKLLIAIFNQQKNNPADISETANV